ncbi:beta-ketoacyl synthase N-terminal-like domain-containing protein [Paraburkholderia caledonica]|uniref:Acyl transferase domain-containing protein n=1 Tax=Paraburkholderia caledonica TaxID=134536 RepID=A0AB73II40_9BURK|nr:acyl transferase domain-containing protein [Paraburkholderia caledonica]
MEKMAQLDDSERWLGKAAVIGLACRFPGAPDHRRYWDNLVAGIESIERFDAADAARNRFAPRTRTSDDAFVGAEAPIPAVDEFDHELFGYTLGEARRLDPQLRVSLQCAHEALEDAACGGLAADEGKVGVFFAASMSTYLLEYLLTENVDGLGALLGSDKDHVATTIAYRLGLTGPAVGIGSGCSGAAAALHYACLSLSTYECDVAIVGGASIIFPQRQGHLYREGGVYSKDGRCRPFCAEASGTVGGSGVGVVVLKRLEDAVRANHDMYCVVAGSACGNDGRRKVGYAAPSVDGQVETIRAALAAAQAEPRQFAYIEAHGTGTALGDPIEIEALGRAFGAPADGRSYCALGSVKANIGHLDSASGIASLIKAAYCIHERKRPPQISFERGHPLVPWATSPFHVDPAGGPLFERDDVRYVGVNSLGMGGTNVFVVLEPAPEAGRATAGAVARAEPILLSAHRPEALADTFRSLRAFVLAQRPNLTDLAYTLGAGRSHQAYRAAFLCSDIDELATQLAHVIEAGGAGSGRDHGDAHIVAWLAGQSIDWREHFPATARRVHLPAYPYRPTKCRLDAGHALAWRHALATLPEPNPHGARGDEQHELEQYCVGLARDFLRERGIAFSNAATYERPQLIAELHLAPAYARFGEYIVDALSARGVLYAEGSQLSLARLFDWPETPAVEARLLERRPHLAPLVHLHATLARERARIVCGGRSVLEVLAGDGYGSIAAAIASDVEKSRVVEAQFDRIDAFLRAFAVRLGRPLRVLEIGCGHLALTDRLLSATASGHLDEYWITDAEARYVARAQMLFGDAAVREGRAVRFTTFDIDRPAAEQGLPVGHYDAIVGFNVLHVAREMRVALSHCAALLGSGGIVCQIDTVDDRLSTQLLWGMLPEWWRYGDARAHGPLLTGDGYRRMLESACDASVLEADREADPESVLWFAAPRPRAADETFVPAWRRLTGVRRRGWRDGEIVLLFADDTDARERIDTLAAAHRATVIGVARADAARTRADDIVLTPGDTRAIHALIHDTLRAHGRIDKVVFSWRTPSLRDAPDDAVAVSLRTLHAVATVLDEALAGAELEWLLVSRGLYRVAGNESLRPEGSLAFDLLRMIELEYPQFRLRHIELPIDAALPAASFELACTCESDNGETIAVRGRHLWHPTYEPIALQGAAADQVDLNGAVIVLVGGLGGLGLTIAEELTRRFRLHLVVIHRATWLTSDAPDGGPDVDRQRIRARLANLAAQAASLQLEQADVNDAAALSAAVDRIERRHARVDGLLYLAGEIDRDGVLRNRSSDALARSVRTKTQGVVNATSAFAALRPRFQVNFSSIGSVLHKTKFGEAGYVIGNGFLNAHARATDGDACKVVCVNWTDWSTQGMWTDAQAAFQARYRLRSRQAGAADDSLVREHWLESISAERGVELLLSVLNGDQTEVVVCAQDLPGLLARQHRATHEDYARYLDALELRVAAPPVPPTDAPAFTPEGTAAVLARIWDELLGTPVCGPDDNFYAQGGDSLLALRLAARVKELCGVDLALSTLLGAQTFDALVASVEAKRSAAPDRREVSFDL